MQHDFNWVTMGERSECRHCGEYESTSCTGDGHGLFEKAMGMLAMKTGLDDSVLCFKCSLDLIRGTEYWLNQDMVLKPSEIVEGTTCTDCGREWSFHGDEMKRTPMLWIKRPAMELMKESIDR